MHPTLVRQLRRLCGVESEAELTQRLEILQSAAVAPELQTFVSGLGQLLERINSTYEQNDRDLELRSRSLEESSTELNAINNQMRSEIASRNRVLESVHEAASKLLDKEEGDISALNKFDLEGLSALLPVLVEQQEQRRIITKHMADKITASEKQYRALVENVREVIFQMDEDGHWLFLNPAWEDITGFTVKESLGKNFLDFIYHDDADKAFDTFKALCAGELKSTRGELRYYTHRGNYCWFELTIQSELEQSTQAMRFTGTLNDVTERKRIAQLQSEFISVVSHELRTPLTSIRGSLSLLEAGMAGTLPEASLKLVHIAHKNSQRLITLVNDILDMEKLMAGKMSLRTDTINLITLVELSIEANVTYAHTLGTHIQLFEHPAEAMIVGDSDRLMQVMANLISNACKFSPKDKSVDVSIHIEKTTAKVSVRDYGAGIPVEFRPRIFSAFAQADSSDTRQQGGTGLGLKISKSLVEKMGGSMGFESEVGVGTCFWFTLPMVSH